MPNEQLFPTFDKHKNLDYTNLLKNVLEAKDTKQKGASLENLATFLANHSTCFRPLGPMHTATTQIDNFFERRGYPGNFLDEMGRSIVVECKNWEEKLGAPVITVVTEKCRNTNSNCAIVFCRAGLTGSKGYDAIGTIRNVFVREKIMILIVDESDLNAIGEGKNLIEILHERWLGVKGLA